MKKSVALILTVIMVIGMIPASLLSAFAHGTGVGANDIRNLSIENAHSQEVPATVTVDGKSGDTAWAYEDWKNVDATTGLWNVTTAKNPNFTYKYQLHIDYEHLYGIFVIDTNSIFSGSLGDITVWINDGTGVAYTDKIVLSANGTCKVYKYGSTTETTDAGKGISVQLCKAVTENGVVTIEFRTLIANITDVSQGIPPLQSYVSVAVNGESLYYPRFAASDVSTAVDPANAWPSNAVNITQWDIVAANKAESWGSSQGNFANIQPSEIHVDGELNEGYWQSFTDYYRSDSDPFDYRHDSDPESQAGYEFADLTVGYSDSMYYYDYEDGNVNTVSEKNNKLYLNDPVTFDGWSIANANKSAVRDDFMYDAQYMDLYTSPVKFKYDLRADDEYLYGAIMANVDCDSSEFYYHIKEYEQSLGGAKPADGTILKVPTFFYVVLDAGYDASGAQNTAYTFKIRYDSEVRYNAASDIWEFTYEYGAGHSELIFTDNSLGSGGWYPWTTISGGIKDANGKEYVSNLTANNRENLKGCVGAKRLNRYLISVEFKFTLQQLGMTDANGNFYKNGVYNADSYDIKYTMAMANVSSMYDCYPKDVAAKLGTHKLPYNASSFSFYSFGYKDANGNVQRYKQGDSNGKYTAELYNGSTYRVKEGEFNSFGSYVSDGVSYPIVYSDTMLPENGYYAYHAWSNGSGTSSSIPVVAKKNSDDHGAPDLAITGDLSSSYWANILAADTIINGMGRTQGNENNNGGSRDNGIAQDADDFYLGKGEASIEDGIITTYYHELAMDDEYLYGAAMIVDGDGVWNTKTGSNTNHDVFRLWIQNGKPTNSAGYNYVINFFIDDTFTNGMTSMPVCNVYSAPYSLVATSLSESEKAGGAGSDAATNKNGYGIEVAMRVVNNYKIRDVLEGKGNNNTGYFTTDLAVLEFKIPLSLIGISNETFEEKDVTAFSYAASKEFLSDNTKGLCWPLTDNGKKGINADDTDPRTAATISSSTWVFDKYSKRVAALNQNSRNARTFDLDGALDEEVWNNEEERIAVNTATGTWNSIPLGEEIYDYSYKVWTGREYLYGGAIIDAELSGDDAFVVWANADGGAKATHKFEFKIENGSAVCYKTVISTGAKTKVSFTDTKQILHGGSYAAIDGGVKMNVLNGKTYLEFMLPLDEIETARDGFAYCVSVNHRIGATDYALYHPDNSNIGSNAQTSTLWLSHYNILASGGGLVIDSPNLIAGQSVSYWARFYFSPTEYQGIYKIDKVMASAGGSVELGSEWRNVYGGNIPQGSFLYMVQGGNANANMGGVRKNTLNYNVTVTSGMTNALSNKVGGYVRFTGLDFETNKINTLYDDQWMSNISYLNYGYATDATYTVVDIANHRTLANVPSNEWDSLHAETITSTGYYIPEDIYIDGNVSDIGWDEDRWIYVKDNVNGNTNNTQYFNCDTDFSYKYQIRMDDEYVYVAAVSDGLSAITQQYNGDYATPAFRIWVKSSDSQYDEAVSFTHFFDVHAKSNGGTGTNLYSETGGVDVDSINAEIKAYQAHYLPKADGEGAILSADGITATTHVNAIGDLGNYDVAYISIPESVIKAANHLSNDGYKYPKGGLKNTVNVLGYGESAMYGETLFHAENLNTGANAQAYQGAWYASIQLNEIEFADQHAVALNNGDFQVEFRFKLSEIGCEDGDDFEYYVETRSETSDAGTSYCLFHPSLPNESATYGGYYARSYHLPYWVWGNTAAKVDAEAREQMRLRNNQAPISSLGASYIESYPYNGENIQALRFGVLYDQKYLDNVNGRTSYTGTENIYENATYWDVKEIGVVLDISKYLYLNNDKTDVILYTDTEYVTAESTDLIQYHQDGSNMADYENYVSYIVCKIPEGKETENITYRGYIDYYPHDDIYYDHWWLTDSTIDDNVTGYTYRPSYYSEPVTRSYDLVQKVADGGNIIVKPRDIMVSIDVGNTVQILSDEIISADGFVYELRDGSDALVANAVTDANGEAHIYKTYSYDDAGTTYNYKLTQVDGNIKYLETDDSVYDVQVTIEYDEKTNVLVPTIKVNGADSENHISVSYVNKYDYTKNNTKVVYIPLDDRPVNYDRAEYIALSSGVDIIMPPREDISTVLAVNGITTSDQGDPRDVFAWLTTNEDAKNAEYYVISLDQIFSGGLVGSRDPFYDSDDSIATQGLELGEYTLSAKEQEIVDYLIELSKTKHVVLLDTVMRLASTNAYGNWDMNTYSFFRNQYSLANRVVLSGANVTVDDVVSKYTVDSSNNKISTVYNGVDYANFVDFYCRARERKLRISDALYSKCVNDVAELFIGVDDSLPERTIQSNEIDYLTTNYISGKGGILFAGADELGLIGLSSVVTALHGEIDVKVEYFGNGKDWAADEYDHESLSANVDKHINAAGANIIASGNADMEILVLTRSAQTVGATDSTAHTSNVNALIAKLEANQAAGIPTCVIDGSSYVGYGTLADKMLSEANAGRLVLTKVMGFSAWNTTGNATGIALGNAVARVAYLKNYSITPSGNYEAIQPDSHEGFMNSIVYSYVKDDAYKKAGGSKCFADSSYFYNEADKWLEGINADTHMYLNIYSKEGVAGNASKVRVANLHFPWNRDFEADFDIQLVKSNSTQNLFTQTGFDRITTTGKANYATFSQGDWWWGHDTGTNDSTDENNAPWAMYYNNGEGLMDGNIRTQFADAATDKSKWFGMGYRGLIAGSENNTWVQLPGDTTPEQNVNRNNGCCYMPSIKFKEPQNIDQIKMHFMYVAAPTNILLPEKVEVTFRDADGKLIGTKVVDNIRQAEGKTVASGSTYWLNITLDEIYEDVSVVVIRPYIPNRSDSTRYLFGWTLMDEIEIYTAEPLS